MEAFKVATKTLATAFVAWLFYGFIALLFFTDADKISSFWEYLHDFNTLSAGVSFWLFLITAFGMCIFAVGFFACAAIYHIWTEWWK